MNWKNNFQKGKELVISTSSKKGLPHANIVISLGIFDGKLLIANCQMKRTIKNLEENKKVCIIGGYFRIKGVAKIFSAGKYFDFSVKENKGYIVKNAILIQIKEVFDLDKVKIIV